MILALAVAGLRPPRPIRHGDGSATENTKDTKSLCDLRVLSGYRLVVILALAVGDCGHRDNRDPIQHGDGSATENTKNTKSLCDLRVLSGYRPFCDFVGSVADIRDFVAPSGGRASGATDGDAQDFQ